MSKFKLGELEPAAKALTNVLYSKDREGQPLKLPFSLSYRLTRLLEHLEKDITYLFSEKQKLAELYAQRGEDGEIISTPQEDGAYTIAIHPDKISEFEAAYQELLNVESELACEPIPGLLKTLMEKDIETDMADAMVLRRFFVPEAEEKE